jgi:hypothetical protein
MQQPAIQAALNNLVEVIRTALTAEFLEYFRGGDVGPRPGKPRKAAGRRTGRSAKAAVRRTADSVEVSGTRILAHLKANPDQRIEQIARALGTDTNALKSPMLKLLARPAKLARKGAGRGTTYRAR